MAAVWTLNRRRWRQEQKQRDQLKEHCHSIARDKGGSLNQVNSDDVMRNDQKMRLKFLASLN